MIAHRAPDAREAVADGDGEGALRLEIELHRGVFFAVPALSGGLDGDSLAHRGEAREGESEAAQRQAIGRRGATVDRDGDLLRLEAGEEAEQDPDRDLHGVLGISVVVERQAEMLRGDQHPGMLPGAIVVEHARRGPLSG
ncbi:MAG: hypothetical protein IPK72_19020 [Candidatus Eisenbacteria bacterium]|nr:hypothetical protein [Candidatus Eisenbacteria bacterium]